MGTLAVVISLITSGVAGLIFWLRRGNIEGIPQPPGNYVFGHLFHLQGHIAKTCLEWKNSIGAVFQMRIFNIPLVFFNDRESIAEICSKPAASGRAVYGVAHTVTDILGEGLITSEGPVWEEQRQFYQKSFRSAGVGRAETERSLQAEMETKLQEWEQLEGSPFELEGCNTCFVFNALWSVVASKRLETVTVLDLVRHAERVGNMGTLSHKVAAMSITLSKLIAKFRYALDEKIEALRAIANIARSTVEEHSDTRVANEPRDLIDMVLDKVDATVDATSTFHRTNSNNGFGIGQLIIAAIDTTSRTLEWLLLHLARNPQAVRKLNAEIDRVFGDDLESMPTLSDQESMPYTQACILEALRLSSVIPFGVPHKALENIQHNGALIPKGTLLLMNLYASNHDPELWERPEKFEPERFLTPEGDMIDVKVKNQVLSFGAGRRMCPGNHIAMDTMFLYVVHSYRKFDFEIVSGSADAPAKFGIVLHPPCGTKLRAIDRHAK